MKLLHPAARAPRGRRGRSEGPGLLRRRRRGGARGGGGEPRASRGPSCATSCSRRGRRAGAASSPPRPGSPCSSREPSPRAGAGPARAAEPRPRPRPRTPGPASGRRSAPWPRRAGLDVEAEIEESRRGGGRAPPRARPRRSSSAPDGRGEVLRATEHLLQRLYGAALQPRALRLTCEGFRERRDEALAEEARRLAEAVRADGQPRTMEPLERLRAADRPRRPAGRAGRHHLQRGRGAGPPRDGGARRPRGPRAGGAATAASEHRGALEALGLGEGAASRLAAYLDTLAAWSRRVNLTGARTPAERVRLLVGRRAARRRRSRPPGTPHRRGLGERVPRPRPRPPARRPRGHPPRAAGPAVGVPAGGGPRRRAPRAGPAGAARRLPRAPRRAR